MGATATATERRFRGEPAVELESGALGSWTWDYVASKRAAAYINRPDAAQIDWDS